MGERKVRGAMERGRVRAEVSMQVLWKRRWAVAVVAGATTTE